MRLSACLALVAMLSASGILHAEHSVYGKLNGLGRYLGYGWGPGYHARELPTIQTEYAPSYFDSFTHEATPQPAGLPMQGPTNSAPLLMEESPVPTTNPMNVPATNGVIPKTPRQPVLPSLPSPKAKSSSSFRDWGNSIFGAAKPTSSSTTNDAGSVR